jgi:hypothetical protein
LYFRLKTVGQIQKIASPIPTRHDREKLTFIRVKVFDFFYTLFYISKTTYKV